MLFWLKKIVAPFLQPLTVAVLLLLAGCFLLWRRQDSRRGRWLVTAGTVWLILITLGPFGGWMSQRLEYVYPPLTDPSANPAAAAAHVIVVLGGGHSQSASLPPTSVLNLETLARVVEAVRLHQALPETRIVFSGGAVYDTKPNAEIMAAAAIALGVAPDAVSTNGQARDTQGEAAAIAAELGQERFILVTSASHMPRAMALFRHQGLDPIPAPTGHHARLNDDDDVLAITSFFPSSGRVTALERTLHEFLGIAWGRLRGQL